MLAKYNGELVAGCKPFPDIPSIFLAVADCKVDQLVRCLVCRERSSSRERFPDDEVQAFYGVRRIDDLADWRIESQERNHLSTL